MRFNRTHVLTLLLVVGSCYLTTTHALAQEALPQRSSSKDFARNSIYLEILGNGLLYSLNYDHKIFDHLSARIGGMYLGVNESTSDSRVSLLLVPVMANYLVGSGSSRLEIGAGLTLGSVGGDIDAAGGDFDKGGVAAFTSTIGYRLQPTNGGFLFRIGFTPIFTANGFLPWAGLSLGGTF